MTKLINQIAALRVQIANTTDASKALQLRQEINSLEEQLKASANRALTTLNWFCKKLETDQSDYILELRDELIDSHKKAKNP